MLDSECMIVHYTDMSETVHEWMTRKEAADLLRVHPRTIDTYIRTGKLHATKISPTKQGTVRISAESVRQLMS